MTKVTRVYASPEAFCRHLQELSYSQARLAQLLDVSSAVTVHNWCSGRHAVPGPVVALIEYLIARPEAKAWFEARRPAPARKVGVRAPISDERREYLRKWAKDQRDKRKQRKAAEVAFPW